MLQEVGSGLPYLAAVPCVPRCEGLLSEFDAFVNFLASDVGGSILAALADEKRARLADTELEVTSSAVQTVFVFTQKPRHHFNYMRGAVSPDEDLCRH